MFDAIIKKNTISYKYKDKLLIKIKIRYKGLLNLDNTASIKEYLTSKLNDCIKYLKDHNIDYLNINKINELRNKNYTYDDILFNINLNKI